MVFSLRNFKKFLLYLIVFLIPFNIKKYLFYFPSNFNISISYNAAFLYLADILILFLLFLSLKDIKKDFSFLKTFYLFFIGVFLSIFGANNLYSFFYSLFHIFLFISFAIITTLFIWKKEINLKNIFLTLGISAFVQGILGILQFKNQSSLGLKFLGESVLDLATSGVARAYTEAGNFLRVYGTMPHANILSAFLFLGFMSFLYLFFKEKKVIFLLPAFLIFFSDFLTFSRSGLFVLFLGIIFSIFYGLLHSDLRKSTLYLFLFLVIAVLVSYFVLGDLMTARFYFSKTEPSYFYRVDYNLMGISLIKEFPVFGVGLGNQIETALNLGFYQKQKLNLPWQWQPIHNLYLLILSETGLVGFVFFIFLLFFVFIKPLFILLKNLFKKEMLDIFYPFTVGVLFLLLGFVDHFFWDLESGVLMFFLVLAMIKGSTKALENN